VSNVIDMFGRPIAERVAERAVPPVRQPVGLEEFRDAGSLQLQRDKQVDRLGTWLAVAAAVGAFFVVRDWRHKRRAKAA